MFRLGLLGYPLTHSLSPRIHQAALQALSLPGEYRLYALAQDEAFSQNLAGLLEGVRSGSLQGLNVTVPYKQWVIPYLDRLDPVAAAIGAVNTIYCQDGLLWGMNTDAPGFLADLQRFITKDVYQMSPGKRALVLGAGGSARAVVFALCSENWRVALAARRPAQAEALADELRSQFKDNRIELVPYQPDGLAEAAETTDLLVNTTPVGMAPHVDGSPWPQNVPFPRRAFAYDLVYNPAQTQLLKQAQQAGLPVCNGIGMLVEQAALAFETWTGCCASRQAMLSAVSEFVLS